jgi:cell division control protein 24
VSSYTNSWQYHVYLFETILLCCKDIDLSKPKNKLASKPLVDKRGKPKLQLKGRIFMQNVTDIVQLAKPGMLNNISVRSSERVCRCSTTNYHSCVLGSYTCQIFWKGDPGIENFIIRFATEDMMRKWTQQIEAQRRKFREGSRNSQGSRTGGTSETQFEFMRNQPTLENPYAASIGEEEDEEDAETLVGSGQPSWASQAPGFSGRSNFSQSRNASQSSLRSRSTTGDSGGPPPSAAAQSRAPPPRFATGNFAQQPQLSLRTRELQQQMISPGERPADSYFSPTPDSPLSSARTSSSSNMYPFPRQQMPQQNGYYEEGHSGTRYTAPAMARPVVGQREPSVSGPNGYPAPSNRGPAQRPGAGMHSAQAASALPRNRSASSPDIQNQQRAPPRGPQPPVPDVPAGYQAYPHMIARSQSNSPNLQNNMPPRGPSQSPQLYRGERGYNRGQQDPSPTTRHNGNLQRTLTPVSRSESFSPAPQASSSTAMPAGDSSPPTQLKVKVHCPSAAQVLTLVVPLNISYQSLKDRIDAKLQRSTNLTLGGGPGSATKEKENVVKLKYLDEDDYVTIQTDEDVIEAFETWQEQRGDHNEGLGMGEIELWCQR